MAVGGTGEDDDVENINCYIDLYPSSWFPQYFKYKIQRLFKDLSRAFEKDLFCAC